jgi:hypothetical protein
MSRIVWGNTLVAVAASVLVATACHDAQGPEPSALVIPGLPGLGSITVSTATTGSSLDPDGYTITVDVIVQSKGIPTNGSVTFTGVPPGVATVSISGVASNCSVSGSNLQIVTVPLGGAAGVAFAISCAATSPPTGDLTVSTSTTGSNPDADGYTLTLDENSTQAIGTNASTTFTGLAAGSHTVVLSGVAANCSATNGTSHTVSVTAGSTASTSFAVSCAETPPPTGDLTVSTATTGSNPDPDGYTVTVEGGPSQPIAPNGSVTFSALSSGSHNVILSGVAGNCSVSGGTSHMVDVPAGGTGSTSFAVSCGATPPPTGDLTVSTSTTGSNPDPDGYTVAVEGGPSQPIAPNGSVTFSGLSAGSHNVVLSGVAGNCSVSGGTSHAVNVPAGGTGSTSFAVSCVAVGGDGTLTVTTSTTGSNLDPDGYTVSVDGSASQPIPTNGSVSFTGPAGDHQVELSGVAANCTVSGANPRPVTVPAGGTTSTRFEVSCAGAPPPAGRVTGRGQVGTAPPQPGNDAVTFDFDVRADLTGRFTGTDYADLHPGGVPATLTTDHATDPETSITAFRSSSSACADPSRGVEIDATGREDTGGVREYTLVVCDNGPANSGMDFFSVFIPSEGFGRSGQVASGDIVKF